MARTMKSLPALSAGLFLAAHLAGAADLEPGFVRLSDGRTFDGWKIGDADAKSWRIEDGAFVAQGNRSHLFYVGELAPFKNFELKVDVMTKPGSNGGIYFHTAFQETGWPRQGFECQVNVTQGDWKKTGSLYDVVNLGWTPAKDNEWWTQHIIVRGNKVTVRINDITVLEYTQPAGVQPGRDFSRVLGEGTFAFQAHDPNSVIHYRNIRVKRLD